MKAIIKFEIEITDFVTDNDYTFLQAEDEIREIIENAISHELACPDELVIKIE